MSLTWILRKTADMELIETEQTLLNGRMVRVGHLVELRLGSPAYYWDGFRNITAGGKRWIAVGRLGAIEGLEEEDDNLQSTELRVTLSGVDSTVLQTAISEDRALYVGKLMIVWLLFFDKEWQPLDTPKARKAGIIDGIEVTRQSAEDGTTVRRLALVAQNIFYGRSTPPASFYSNRDQQFRFPGDRGLDQVSDVQERVVPVPW